jgi:hypothetical protein
MMANSEWGKYVTSYAYIGNCSPMLSLKNCSYNGLELFFNAALKWVLSAETCHKFLVPKIITSQVKLFTKIPSIWLVVSTIIQLKSV